MVQDILIHTTGSHKLLESIPEGYISLDESFIVRYWNLQAERLTGLSKEEVLGRNYWNCFPEEVGKGFYTQYHYALQKGHRVSFEDYAIRPGRWFEVIAYPQEGGLSVFFKDITDRKLKEQELEEIRTRFEYVIKATSAAIYDVDIETNRSYWFGENFHKLFGYAIVNSETPNGFWDGLVHPEDHGRVMAGYQENLSKGNHFYAVEYRFRRKDGSFAVVRDRSSILWDARKRPTRVIGAMEDITEQKRAELSLINNEQKYRTLFNNAPLPQWIYDVETFRILDVNEAGIRHYGYSKEELLNRTILDMLPEGEREPFLHTFQDTKATGSLTGTWRHKKKDGSIIIVEASTTLIHYNGAVARLATINDITEKEKAKEALLKSEENYKRLFNSAPLPQYICHRDSLKILKVNDAAISQYGYSKEEFLQMTPFDLRPVEEHPSLVASVKILEETGENRKLISSHIKKSGEKIIVELNEASLEYEDQPCILVTITDITNELKLEEKISELKVSAQKKITKAQIQAQEKEREEIGRELHDNINQQLTTTKLYMDLAKEREDLRLSLIEKSEKVLLNTINEIRTLSKSLIPSVLKDIGLQQALYELIESIKTTRQFDIHLSYADELDAVEEDLKVCFYRVVQEQLTNISKYAEAANAWVEFKVVDALIYLTVRDDGKGFEPAKRRTGVGIANIRNRVVLYNGSMSLDSSPGNGCTLTVQIPYEGFDGEKSSNLHIVVAEDSSEDRAFLKTAFEQVSPDSTLLFRENGLQLLEYLQSISDNNYPDLIVMDYNMPLLNGLDTLQALHLDQRLNRIPKIIYSTSSNKRHKEKSLAAFATAYIEKGSTPNEMLENVKQMLSFALHH